MDVNVRDMASVQRGRSVPIQSDRAVWSAGEARPGLTWRAASKRTLDLILSVVALPLLMPVFGVIAILVCLDSRGPALYLDQRIGRRGRCFTCFKFRTMYVASDGLLQQHLADNATARREWQRYRKLQGYDPRVTRIGRILRKLSLDELPQVFNVLRGDMSLVGPRPYLPSEWELMDGYREWITQVKPGLTGVWQVLGRNRLPFSKRLVLDRWYVRHWCLWLDLVVLWRTIGVVLTGRGAY